MFAPVVCCGKGSSVSPPRGSAGIPLTSADLDESRHADEDHATIGA